MATSMKFCFGHFLLKKTSVLSRIANNNCSKSYRLLYNSLKLYSTSRKDGSEDVRIGCASGFWGDTTVAAPQLIHKGNLDFLVFDYLSEITMSLMTAAKTKYPDFGYAPDFVQFGVGPYLKTVKEKGIKVVSNAGGVNPYSCAKAMYSAAQKAGVDIKVAVITGDNLIDKKAQLESQNIRDLDSDKLLPSTVNSMNAYIGAFPIAKALDMGADIVITGRCVDSALVLGPLIHKFKWQPDQFDLLSAGSLAGHLIECGAQATGGIFTDWYKLGLHKTWSSIGFPIVQCQSNGDFIVTKPVDTGGLVSIATVAEQLVYEIGDPKNYILPDVICDFSDVKLTQEKENEVKVCCAKGKSPPNDYKVSATYADGFKATTVAVLAGLNLRAKGLATANAILQRTRTIFEQLGLSDYTQTHIQVIGGLSDDLEESFSHFIRDDDRTELSLFKKKLKGEIPKQAALWIAVEHSQKKALELFAREIAPAGTGMAPGVTGMVGGRPKVSPIFKFFSFLYQKKDVSILIDIDGTQEEYEPWIAEQTEPTSPAQTSDEMPIKLADFSDLDDIDYYQLKDVGYARSGDKGNTVNIGVIARHPDLVPYLNEKLTAEAVGLIFQHLFEDESGHKIENGHKLVKRFYLAGINAFNFVLPSALGGGGVASLRPDPQGKGAAQMLLDEFYLALPKNTMKSIIKETD